MGKEKMPFGDKVLSFNFPSEWEKETLRPNPSVPAGDPHKIILQALKEPIHSSPLQEIVKPGQRVTILISDITRVWVRTDFFLPFILRILEQRGVRTEDIVLIVATGSHRDNTPEEMRTLVGQEVFQKVKVLNHHAKDEKQLTYLGKSQFGTEVWINRLAIETDLTIVTGGITFHSLSGFAGGRKGIVPGISGYDTIQQNHRLCLKEGGGVLDTVKKGKMDGNLVSQDMLAVARMVPNTFLFNVVMDEEGKLVQAVSGDLEKAHLNGCKTVKEMSSVSIRQKGDVVLASPGGYPWDISLYQSIKTLESATFATREGGTIILVTECRDSLGPADWVQWFDLGSAEEIEKELWRRFTIPGFIALKTVKITQRFPVILVIQLAVEHVKKVGMIPASSIDGAIFVARERKKDWARSIFIPHGSFVLPVHTP
jgi:nickel-dependent lactate racemase